MSMPSQSGNTMQEPPQFTTTVTMSYLLSEFPTGTVSIERLFSEISRSKVGLPLKSVVVRNEGKVVVCVFNGPRLDRADERILDSIVQRHDGRGITMSTDKPMTTGFALLDRALGGGLQRASVFLLTSAAGQGKTNFVINMAVSQARDGLKVVYVCLEETYPQIYKRVAAHVSGIPLSMLDAPTPDVKRKVKLSMRKVEKTNLKITGSDVGNIEELLEALLAVPGGVDILILDSINTLKYNPGDSDTESLRMRGIGFALKGAASNGNMCVITTASDRLDRSGKSNMRMSPAVETADYWLRIQQKPDTLTQHGVTVNKNRFGRSGTEFLAYIDGSRVRTALNTGRWVKESVQAEPRT